MYVSVFIMIIIIFYMESVSFRVTFMAVYTYTLVLWTESGGEHWCSLRLPSATVGQVREVQRPKV